MRQRYVINETSVRVAMARTGFRSIVALARAIRVSEGLLRNVFAGLTASANVRAKMASVLHATEAELFTEIQVAGHAEPGIRAS